MPSQEPDVSLGLTDLEHNSFVKPTSPNFTGQLAAAVANPDGTIVGTGATTTANQGARNASHAQSWWVQISDTTSDLALATAGADALTNSTIGIPVYSLLSGFNGTTWDRLRVDASKNLNVNVNAALPAGTNVIGALSANQSVNQAQIAGTTTSVNNGVTDAGTARVTLSSDSTGQVKLAAGTNVIGHIIADSGSTTAVTGNVTVVQPTGTNLHAVLDTTSTTAVTQATGTNLHTVVDSGTITTVSTVTTLSQLPSTAALADATANPTLTEIQTFPMGFNGTTWDRLQVDASKNLKVLVNSALPAGTNVIGHIIVDSGTITSITNALPTGTNTLGSVKITDGTNTASVGTGTTKALLASVHDGTNLATVSTESLNSNLNRVNGTAVTTGVGASGAGTQRVVTSTDSTIGTVTAVTAITNALPAGTNIIGALSLHQSTNVDQIGGSGLTLGAKASASSVPVVIANDQAPPPIVTGTAIASGTYTTTQTQADVTSNGYKGVKAIFNISAYTDGTYKLEIDGKDPISGNYFALVADATGLTSATLKTYTVYPSIVAVASQNAADILTSTWRIKVVASGTTAGATFSVSYELIP